MVVLLSSGEAFANRGRRESESERVPGFALTASAAPLPGWLGRVLLLGHGGLCPLPPPRNSEVLGLSFAAEKVPVGWGAARTEGEDPLPYKHQKLRALGAWDGVSFPSASPVAETQRTQPRSFSLAFFPGPSVARGGSRVGTAGKTRGRQGQTQLTDWPPCSSVPQRWRA